VKADGSTALELLKLQFREEKQGQSFYDKLNKLCEKTNK
jgi:hypothetical protein